MSRIGTIPVSFPKEVKIAIEKDTIHLEGPKGKVSLKIPAGISAEKKDNSLLFKKHNDLKQTKADHGTTRALIVNIVEGITQGHKKELEIQGVGFRAQLQGSKLLITLGFSHPVEFEIPKEVKLTVAKPTEIKVEGIDKCLVGQVAAQIRGLKPPEPYKGKGIRYLGEYVRRKQGKAITK